MLRAGLYKLAWNAGTFVVTQMVLSISGSGKSHVEQIEPRA
jgi:hypothetical protein